MIISTYIVSKSCQDFQKMYVIPIPIKNVDTSFIVYFEHVKHVPSVLAWERLTFGSNTSASPTLDNLIIWKSKWNV